MTQILQKDETKDLYDPLTNLPNRRLLNERLVHELNLARRYNRAGVILFLDLDHFKKINDSLGRLVGDQILIETAQRLQTLLRETDTAVRLEEDEFVILSSAQDGITYDLTEQSHAIAEKIINVILEPYYIDIHELHLTASIGITLYTGHDESVELLLKKADAAMYKAKEGGRNTYRFYQKSIQEAEDDKLDIESNLKTAISKHELSIHYQPQYSDNKTLFGVEALLRWNNPILGQLPPLQFIPIAEESGLILEIEQWLLEGVCKQINEWDMQNLSIPRVAINISPEQFHQAGFVINLAQTVLEYEVNPDRLILEIKEDVFLNNIEDVIDKMHVLKKKGFKFSLDDFGSGYSSLTFLKRLSFDQLKLEQMLIKGFINQPTDVAFVKAIITMVKGLGIDLIAEGVETEEHLAFLSSFGCKTYQGYCFSKPLPIEHLSKHLNKTS